MRINNNISAMNTYSRLSSAQSAQSKSLEKLSSGLRINKAGDDAAGLAISEKMRGQIGGLNQAVRNAQDGISLIQTAEGALSETHSILNRMRELGVQSANDTNTLDDRREIQKEVEQLKSEINRISNSTEFNTQKLLNGSLGATGSANNANVTLNSVSGLKTGDYNVTIDTAATKATLTGSVAYADNNAINAAFGVADKDITINGVQIDTSNVTNGAQLVTAINNKSESTGFTASWNTTEGVTFTANEFGSGKSLSFGGSNSALIDDGNTLIAQGVDAIVSITDENDVTESITGTGQLIDYRGSELLASGASTSTSTITVSSSGAALQIGANKDQNMLIDINEMSTSTLGSSSDKIKDINVSTQEGANNAVEVIDAAIKSVSAERSKLGAVQNRLDHTINNLTATSENLTAAESRIRDVDMAKEMMTFTKNNILNQAATAMLAQANQMPQGVLQLLR